MAPVNHQETKEANKKWPHLDLAEFRSARKIGAALGFTTSHWPGAIPANNLEYRARHASFKPIQTPTSCFKRVFAASELALLEGHRPVV
jgi:hypothetical protein